VTLSTTRYPVDEIPSLACEDALGVDVGYST
jgi:hypothetical protein